MVDAGIPVAPEAGRMVPGRARNSLARRLRLWQRHHRTRQQLSRLSDHQLADIGLRPEGRARECRKWFWQK